MTVRDFVYEVDSASPAPGGGSVSSVSAALGTGLLRMIGHLTIPKKKFNKLDEAVQRDFVNTHERLKALEHKLLDLVDRDTDAFNDIMHAFKMPKETDTEKKKRAKAIEQATMKAIEVPEGIADVAFEALQFTDFIRQHGNKNALSDVGVGTLMLYAGLEGACLNIKINLPGISDDAIVASYASKVEDMLASAKQIKDEILEKIHQDLTPNG